MHLKKLIQKAFVAGGLVPNQKMKVYKCRYCGKQYAYHVTRMAQHLKRGCVSCPSSIKNILKNKSSISKPKLKRKRKSQSSDSSKENVSCENDSSESDVDSVKTSGDPDGNETPSTSTGVRRSSTPGKNQKTSYMAKFCDRMSKVEQGRLHELLATAIYASGTPLSITESIFWQDFFKSLRPSYDLPSRYEISNSLLDKSYNKLKLDVDQKVQSADSVGLQCDGWSNLRNEGIINFIVTTPEPVFFKTITTTTNSQTGEYIAAQMKEVIDVIGSEKVLGVCTDNAAAMKSAWRILQDQYQGNYISFYGCSAHILNLLIKDAMSLPSIDKISKNGTAIVKEIKEKHILSATFAEIQQQDSNKISTTLKLPGKTRFGSLIICLQSLVENKHNLQALAISRKADSYLKPLTKNVILGQDFWVMTVKTLALLKPVGKWITVLEGDSPKLSLVPEAFHELKNHFVKELEESPLRLLSDAETKKMFAAFDKRRSMAINRAHFAANILDPSLRGRNLNDDDSVDGTALIFELANKFNLDEDNLLKELTEYTTDTGIWSQEYIRRAICVTSAQKWWKALCGTTKLSKIAVAILDLPATSAATERTFSTCGWIHSSKRNRLSTKRAGMISYIAHNLKLLRPKADMKIGKKHQQVVSDTESESSSDHNLEAEEEKDGQSE